MSPEDLYDVPLFAELSDERLAWLVERAEEQRLAPGEWLFEEGGRATHFWVLLAGELEGIRTVAGGEVVVITHEPRGYIGAIPLLTGQPYMAGSRAVAECRLARWDAEAFRGLVRAEPAIEQTFLRVFAPAFAGIEAATQQREKLATLGGLAAGLAHELNNPAAAARRASGDLREAVRDLDGAVATFAELDVPAPAVGELVRLRAEAAAVERAPLGALDAADREDELASWLEEQGVEEAWDLAPTLVAGGLDLGFGERVLEAAGAAALPAALGWMGAGLRAVELLDQLEDSTDRVSRLVKAVKDYSYMDQAPEQEVDLAEGLDSTLTMLGHKLRKGSVEVVRDYDRDLPRVSAYGSELNQVWTNLIDNAIDAVDGAGTITVRTARQGDRALIEIGDDGPGVPEDLRARIFEPFFTTKDVGHGSGLGLDISHRIVVGRHHGDIRVESSPGDTRVQVRLPLGGRAGSVTSGG